MSVCVRVATVALGLALALAVGLPPAAAQTAVYESLAAEGVPYPIPAPEAVQVSYTGEAATPPPAGSPAPEGAQVAFADDAATPPPASSATPDAKPLGTAPADTSELFLRTETVLLQPGQIEIDNGFEYIWQETRGVVVNGGVPEIERVRLRQWFDPMAIRFGLTDELQPYLNVPWGGAEFERSSPFASDSEGQFGLGDISGGFNYLLLKHQDCGLDVIGGLGFTAPTGLASFQNLTIASPDTATLGNGFWAVSANLNFVKSIDPAVIFGGIGYEHEFAAGRDGDTYTPGEIFNYRLGMGFAINDSLTLSTTFQGAWEGLMRVDHVAIPDSSQEPFTLRFGLTIVASKCAVLEPFVRIGLNSDAPAADFGLIYTRRI